LLRRKLTAVRRLILDTARKTEGVGAIEETLKWSQPSSLTSETGSRSTIRIDALKSDLARYALYSTVGQTLCRGFETSIRKHSATKAIVP
jgi:hypothetical protein